ncbi:hypothetical protein [Streptomyces sp. NPDC002851]
MPASIPEEGSGVLDAIDEQGRRSPAQPLRSARPRRATPLARTALSCPSCGSVSVAQVLGDNGGISYVCTACGHSWS